MFVVLWSYLSDEEVMMILAISLFVVVVVVPHSSCRSWFGYRVKFMVVVVVASPRTGRAASQTLIALAGDLGVEWSWWSWRWCGRVCCFMAVVEWPVVTLMPLLY